ncbi:adenylate kinase isoenzyme 1-like [Anticarsia gemmatalis]|uniref:adenylate kinase isoenzyme 1-like n=1 Tax=Anticarsia gemmatalis TaxID=129554 RepID=UPI003F76946E
MERRLCPNCGEMMVDKQPPCPLSCMSTKCQAYQKKTIIDVSLKPVVWILGGPGVGKSTQCQNVTRKYGLEHLAIGDLLRAEAVSGSDRANCLKSILRRGGLVPADIVLDLVKETIAKKGPGAKGFVIDGFPREKTQGIGFEEAVGPASAIISIEASKDTLLQRLKACAKQSDRIDDNDISLMMRIETFLESNHHVLAFYKSRVIMIDGEGSPDSIFSQIQKILDPVVQAATNATSQGNK